MCAWCSAEAVSLDGDVCSAADYTVQVRGVPATDDADKLIR
jgi:hypothetical protein